jgi:hypothetical protein
VAPRRSLDEPDPPRESLCAVAAPAGVWQTVASCCSRAVRFPEFAADIFVGHADQFVVTYLPWPGLPEDDPGCMVVFVRGDELQSTVAFCNPARL